MTRDARLKLTIADAQLELLRLDASEAMSQPFHITLDFISTLGEFDLFPHLGKPAMVESLHDGEHLRYFHGVITDGYLVGDAVAASHGWSGSAYHYRVTLQPKAYFHDQGSDYRIFQDKTVIDIIKDVLGRRGIDHLVKLQAGAAADLKRKYCVQFGESDMSFVYRLMEEHGIYYYYQHEEHRHVMVLCDAASAHTDVAIGHLDFNPLGESMEMAGSGKRGHTNFYITQWNEHLRSGAESVATMRDYHFKTPRALPTASVAESGKHVDDKIEVFVWPGRYYKGDDGTKLAKVLIESRRAQRIRYDGVTSYTGIQVGRKFKLRKHPVQRFNESHLIIATHTSLSAEQYRSGGGGGGETEVHFTTIPAKAVFRAPHVTPRPMARGPETAVVVGPKGEEIYVDKYGRIKVQFHWDRLGQKDEHSSCWIRVSQTGGLGNVIHPRVGHEVLVDFIAGDPDRPIVVGRVFNEDYMPVYDLPANKTRAVWRSKTYKREVGAELAEAEALDTGKPAANEIRMEDATGAEEFFLHAEKDMNTRVRNIETHRVGKDQAIRIGKNRDKSIGESETVEVGKNRTEEVKGDEKIKIGGNRVEEVKGDETITIKGNEALKIQGTDTQQITGAMKITCKDEITITAAQKITLKCGASTIVIDTASITCKTLKFEAKAMTLAKIQSTITKVLGSGLTKIQGAIVKIN